jgi:3',5'-cyclic AMP phosphodiesterase CpdA
MSRRPQGRRLFSFVVVADTHVNESDHTTRSPFASNLMANQRARHVFGEIAAMEPAPEFVVHLGDMVHPVPNLPGYEDAAACFRQIAGLVPVPVHLVPGNHDIGEKNLDGVPAEIICDEYVAKYNDTFGRDYYSFGHGNAKFIVVNTLLFNSGLAAEERQKAWLDGEIAGAGKRTFVFTHYPPYLREPGESGMYDTLDEPARGWLLERLRRDNVEAVFCGHVHNFWYDVVGRAELYLLPSTAFLRHDYTEFYRVHPGEEHGRCDTGKLGYFVVEVYEQGHVAHLVRTHGECLPADRAAPARRLAPRVHTKTSTARNFGVEMRHAWAEVAQIPCTGGIEEFGRKLARNDYQLMALWEMGLRSLKVPEQDLDDAQTAARAKLMSEVGHDFIVTAFGVPDDAFMRRMAASAVNVSAVEVNLPLQKFRQRTGEVARLRKATAAKIVFSKLRTSEDAHFDGQHFSHFVNAGLQPAEFQAMKAEIAAWVREGTIDGVTVRLDRGTDIVAAAAQLSQLAEETRCEVIASVKLSHKSLAGLVDDDPDTARLAAEAFVASASSARVRYVFDTFMDIDRGYFPRKGFIDRRFNPRPAGLAVASLMAMLPGDALRITAAGEEDGCRVVDFSAGERRFSLLSGAGEAVARRLGKSPWQAGTDLLTRRLIACGRKAEEERTRAAAESHALVCVEHASASITRGEHEFT